MPVVPVVPVVPSAFHPLSKDPGYEVDNCRSLPSYFRSVHREDCRFVTLTLPKKSNVADFKLL